MKKLSLFICTTLLLLLGVFHYSSAAAHELDSGHISVLLKESEAMVVVSPEISLFPFADDNGNGLLSVQEVETHQAAIQQAVVEQIVLKNEAGTAASIAFIEAFVSGTDTGNEQRESDFLQIYINYMWDTAPEVVDIDFNLFNPAGDSVNWIMKDEQTDEILEGEFNPNTSVIRLRGEGTPAESGLGIWFSGVEHVLTGYDHILFILALVLATAGFRKLLWPLTAFTIAHTITLAAVAFGFEPPVPAWLIEATIAASIAILAGIYLYGISTEVWWITAILGLIHGLGFGQAMTDSLGSLQAWGTALVSITIGVELTHLAIALLGLGALQAAKHLQYETPIRRTVSITILCVGLLWTFQRIPF